MANHLAKLNAEKFGFTTFAKLIGEREPVTGETNLPFDIFHDQLVAAFEPMTPYEAVIAENLIDIEWELYQHRRMRHETLRRVTQGAIRDAVFMCEKVALKELNEADFQVWASSGEAAEEFEVSDFDEEAAKQLGNDLARRIVDADVNVRNEANEELEELGLSALEIMSNAYRSQDQGIIHHDDKIQELERRRRQVKADFDALQNARPLDVEVIEG